MAGHYPDPRSQSDDKLQSDIERLWQGLTMELDGPDAIMRRIQLVLCTDDVITYEGINANYAIQMKYFLEVKTECTERRLIGPDTNSTKALHDKLHTAIRSMGHLRELAVNLTRYETITRSKIANPEDDVMLDNVGLSDADKEKNNRQEVLEHFMNLVYRHNLRRCGSSLYTEKLVSVSTRTFFWEQFKTIEEYVWSNCNSATNYDLWKKMNTTYGLHDAVIKHLEKTIGDPRVKDISPSRYWFSWLNGIYSVENNEFYLYEEAMGAVPNSVMSCKFFNEVFDVSALSNRDTPELIATPNFDTIMNTQRLSSEHHFISESGHLFYSHPEYPGKNVKILTWNEQPYTRETADRDSGCPEADRTKLITDIDGLTLESVLDDERWTPDTNRMAALIFLAMLGRLLYSFRDKHGHLFDNWQRILFVKGLAGTGKSTIAQIVKNIYPANQVGTINSKCEENFPIYSLYDKYLWMCPEVRYNFGLDTALFQSMVSGDSISIAIKNKDAVAVDWNIPGLIIGNQFPKIWSDAGGSIIRRVLLADFKEIPDKVDPGIVDRILTTEMSSLIVKLNSTYLKLKKLLQDSGQTIDDILPPYFRITRNMLMNEVHTLFDFLCSPNLEFGHEHSCTLKEFRTQFNIFCGNKGLPQQKWTPDFYTLPLKKHKLKIGQDTKKINGSKVSGLFVFGVQIKITEESERIGGGR
jgi:hypothetical protein